MTYQRLGTNRLVTEQWIPAFARKTRWVNSRIREKDEMGEFPHSRERRYGWIPAFARKTIWVDSRVREKDEMGGFPRSRERQYRWIPAFATNIIRVLPIPSYQKLGTNYLVSILI
jgi:hypothetical protein